MVTFNLTVTEKHFTQGRPDDPIACPVCFALMDLFPTKYIEVTRADVKIGSEVYPIQPDMLAFIDTVDAGRKPILPAVLKVGR